MEGKNTFGCKINGEVFVADGSGSQNPTKGIYAVIESNGDSLGNIMPLDSCSLIMSLKNKKNSFFVYINRHLLKDPHLFNSNTYEYPVVVNPKNYVKVIYDGNKYITTVRDTGSLKITKWDQKKFIISGTFQFQGSTTKDKKIVVTDGRFDFDYSKTH